MSNIGASLRSIEPVAASASQLGSRCSKGIVDAALSSMDSDYDQALKGFYRISALCPARSVECAFAVGLAAKSRYAAAYLRSNPVFIRSPQSQNYRLHEAHL